MRDSWHAIRRGSIALAMVLLGTGPLDAQIQSGQFLISVRAEHMRYAESAALETSGAVGVETMYFLTSHLAVGFQASVARPWTKGEYFPLMRHTYWTPNSANDTTLLYVVSQQVTAFDYGLQAEYRLALGRFEPMVQAGVGRYTFFLDPQSQPQSDRERRTFSGLAYSVGGGLSFAVSEDARIMVTVSDRIYTGFDRDNLSLADRLLREDRFPNPLPPPPPEEDVIHNLRISAGFSFAPGRGR
ncbi:MAG: hypothetical protein DIU52_005975 [bacterium]|jgi:hypothetical protein|nr:MAG: hypothetical protein DIU52_11965 [bacterium]